MSYNDVLSFVKENPACFLATMDGNQPRVRGFLSVFFEGDDSIYFTTGGTKNVYRQLCENPNVEICFVHRSGDAFRMLRITGIMEILDDRAKKQELIERQFYLKGFKADDPNYILLRISHGQARFWTLENNMKPAPVIEF